MSTVSRSNWNLKVLVFLEGGKPETLGKNILRQGESQLRISKGNHAKFACFVLLADSGEEKTLLCFFFFVQCIVKQLLGLKI